MLVKGEVHCNSCNVIYLVECSNFKQQFRIHKSYIKTKNIVVGLLGILIASAVTPVIPIFLKTFIEQVLCNDADKDIEAILWEREKY